MVTKFLSCSESTEFYNRNNQFPRWKQPAILLQNSDHTQGNTELEGSLGTIPSLMVFHGPNLMPWWRPSLQGHFMCRRPWGHQGSPCSCWGGDKKLQLGFIVLDKMVWSPRRKPEHPVQGPNQVVTSASKQRESKGRELDRWREAEPLLGGGIQVRQARSHLGLHYSPVP